MICSIRLAGGGQFYRPYRSYAGVFVQGAVKHQNKGFHYAAHSRMIAGRAALNLQQTLAAGSAGAGLYGEGFPPPPGSGGINRVMRYREDQPGSRFKLNIGEAKGWLVATETAEEGPSALASRLRSSRSWRQRRSFSAELMLSPKRCMSFTSTLSVWVIRIQRALHFWGYCTGSAPYGWEGGTLRISRAGERRRRLHAPGDSDEPARRAGFWRDESWMRLPGCTGPS